MSMPAARPVAMSAIVAASVLAALQPVAAAGQDLPNLFAVHAGDTAPPHVFASRPLAILDMPDGRLPALVPDSALQGPPTVQPRAPGRAVAEPPGPGAFVPLAASFAALQLLDVHSTLLAVNRGARERNPLMAPFADRPAALIAVKAGTAAAILYMTERVNRRNRLAATVMMVAFTSAYATVVANNYRVAARLGRR